MTLNTILYLMSYTTHRTTLHSTSVMTSRKAELWGERWPPKFWSCYLEHLKSRPDMLQSQQRLTEPYMAAEWHNIELLQ
jgi:hypothetical protein